MLEKLNQTKCGYKLYDFDTHYELHGSFGVFRGNLRQVTTYAVLEHGFEVREIEIGLIEAERKFMSGMEFGIFKKFMWPFDPETEFNTKLH